MEGGGSSGVLPYLRPSPFTTALVDYLIRYDRIDDFEEDLFLAGSNSNFSVPSYHPDVLLRKRQVFKHLHELEVYRNESGETRFVGLIELLTQCQAYGSTHGPGDEVRLPKNLSSGCVMIAARALNRLLQSPNRDDESIQLMLEVIGMASRGGDTVEAIMSNFPGVFGFDPQPSASCSASNSAGNCTGSSNPYPLHADCEFGETANKVLSMAKLAPVDPKEMAWAYNFPEIVLMPQIYVKSARDFPWFSKGLQVVKDFTEGVLDYGRRLHLYCGFLCIVRRAYPTGCWSAPRTDSRIVYKSHGYRKLMRTLLKSIDLTLSMQMGSPVPGHSTTNMLLTFEESPTVSTFLMPFHGGDRFNESFTFVYLRNWGEFGRAVIRYFECSGALEGPDRISPNVLEEFISIVVNKINDYELWRCDRPKDSPPFRFHREFVERVMPLLVKSADFYPRFQPPSPAALPFSIRYIMGGGCRDVCDGRDYVSQHMFRIAVYSEKFGGGCEEEKLYNCANINFYRVVVNKFYAILRLKWPHGINFPFPLSLASFGRIVGKLLSLPAPKIHMQSVFLLLVLTIRALYSQASPMRELGKTIIGYLISATLASKTGNTGNAGEKTGEKKSGGTGAAGAKHVACGKYTLPLVRGITCYPQLFNKISNEESLKKLLSGLPSQPAFLKEIHYLSQKILDFCAPPQLAHDPKGLDTQGSPEKHPPDAPAEPMPGVVSSVTGVTKPVPWTQRQLPWDERKVNKLDFLAYLDEDPEYAAQIEQLKNNDGFFPEHDQLPPFPFQFVTKLLYIVEAAKGIAAYRALLKTLGTWLGAVTLKRNKPILAKQLNLKHLVMDGYERGVLIAVLPFVCKILEHVKESKIFKLPNPWTLSILTAVAHLHRLPRLKTNRIFEIELLFKNLDLPSPKIWLPPNAASPFTQQPASDADLENEGADKPESEKKGLSSIDSAITAEALAKLVVIPESISASFISLPFSKLSVGQAIERAIKEVLPIVERSVATGVKCSRHLVDKDYMLDKGDEAHLLSKSVADKMSRYVPRAPGLDKRGGAPPILPCKAAMALNSCSLSHSLAAVSARVMLNSLLLDNLFSLIRKAIEDPGESRGLAVELVSANMDLVSRVMSQIVQSLLACSIPESKAFVDARAFEEDRQVHFLPGRKNAISWSVVEPPAAAPSALPPAPPAPSAPLAPSETFFTTYIEVPFQVPPVSGLATSTVLKKFSEYNMHLRRAVAQVLTFPPPVPTSNSIDQPCQVRGLAPSHPIPSAETLALGLLSCLPSDHQIFTLARSIRYLCRNAANKPEIYHTIGTKLLKSGNEAILQAEKSSHPRSIDQSAIILEIELAIFELLCNDWPGLRTLTSSFVMVPSYMNVNRVTLFVRFNLLNLETLDKFLAAHLDNNQGVNANAVEFTIRVLHKLLVEHGYATCRHFNQCITKLSKVSSRVLAHKRTNIGTWNRMDLAEAKNRVLRECKNGKVRGENRVRSLTNLLKQYSNFQTLNGYSTVVYRSLPAPPFISDKVRQGAVALFTEWMAILTLSGNGESEFLKKLSKAGYLRLDEVTDMFYAISLYLSLCIAHCGAVEYKSASEKFEKSDLAGKVFCDVFQRSSPLPPAGQVDMSYIRGWARLVVRMIALVDPNQISPVIVLQKLLHIVCRVIHKASSLCICVAMQRPFYRLFDYIIRGIVEPDALGSSLEPHQIGLLQSIASALLLVSPVRVPDFTYGWIQLVSNLLPHLLSTNLVVKRRGSAGIVNLKGPHLWDALSQLLVHLLQLLGHAQSAKLTGNEGALIYDSAIFIFTFIHNKCGEFLAAYSLKFNEAISGDFFQLRNIICSAIPAPPAMPEPPAIAAGNGNGDAPANFSASVPPGSAGAMENSPEWGPYKAPIMTPTTWICGVPELKTAIDAYFYANGGKEHVSRIYNSLLRAGASDGEKYDLHLLNQTILYVAVVLPKYSGEASIDTGKRLLIELAAAMDVQGKYVLASSLSNHLRYNCKVTNFFHDLLLESFTSDNLGGTMQEIIARIILLRTLPSGPKPWGLRQLVKSFDAGKKVDFWNLPIIASVPCVKALFEKSFKELDPH